MNAIVVPFPKAFSPRPKNQLKLPAPRKGAGGAWVTSYGEFAGIPFTWDRFLRLLVIIEPVSDDRQPVNEDTCHKALAKLAIDYARSCFGEGVQYLLRMLAVLEKSSSGGFLYTILFEAPDHALPSRLVGVALESFEGLTHNNDAELPMVTVSTGAGSGEVFHLVLRSIEGSSE